VRIAELLAQLKNIAVEFIVKLAYNFISMNTVFVDRILYERRDYVKILFPEFIDHAGDGLPSR
jgi:hypothetical protein